MRCCALQVMQASRSRDIGAGDSVVWCDVWCAAGHARCAPLWVGECQVRVLPHATVLEIMKRV